MHLDQGRNIRNIQAASLQILLKSLIKTISLPWNHAQAAASPCFSLLPTKGVSTEQLLTKGAKLGQHFGIGTSPDSDWAQLKHRSDLQQSSGVMQRAARVSPSALLMCSLDRAHMEWERHHRSPFVKSVFQNLHENVRVTSENVIFQHFLSLWHFL